MDLTKITILLSYTNIEQKKLSRLSSDLNDNKHFFVRLIELNYVL